MDVTPQVINEVEFHQKMRGYDPDEVDDFLERVAVAVGQLTERLQESEAKAVTADRRVIELERKVRELSERPAGNEDETETIRRTLVLAQKTADAAVKEAEEEAQRTVAEAQATSQRLVSEAEAEARRTSEDTRQRLVDEISTLEATREALKGDHVILERHLEDQRLRLRGTISDLQRLVDDPETLRVASAPELSGASRPLLLHDETAAAAAWTADDDVIDLDAESRATAGTGDDTGDDVAVERPITGGVTFSPPEEANTDLEADAPAAVAMEDDGGETDAWSRFVRNEMLDRPTEAVDMSGGDDAYLIELRKALHDDSGPDASGERASRARFGPSS